MATDEAAEDIPAGVHHFDTAEDVPFEISKYWHQRKSIFSRYDEGIWMTDDLWFGVTPEPVAKKISSDIASAPASKRILIDAFAGAGGNTIQFALSGRWNQIFAVEKDATVLACAKHNAEIYGVAKKIVWIHGDVFDVLAKKLKFQLKNAVIFGSPPWGGPTYADYEVFDLDVMEPYSLTALHQAFSKGASHVVLYLPRTSALEQIAQIAQDGGKMKVIHYCMFGSSKALCAYIGGFAIE
ncbi:hypothetical protein B0A48_06796 [Cryoendolithus antarcticus]|uniref:Trimethylguanosine synthase n=1 Tax=Cryoendolithus antarcticus TaxID=1507870 RepID=A0A1V8T9C6_9PEZI|nr:hypothetical protein B0A48_06796 [Cryoendolithus antarcticus]